MLTQEMNERLTRVGPGTPVGELLRRYWQPVAAVSQLDDEPVLAVKVLGENLALYRADNGEMGLMAQRCPHRGASLAYGIPEEGGLRCPYHGWKFSPAGQCTEQPAEPDESTFKHRIKIPAYPVQEMGGLVWAYFGPEPAPLLPRFDLYVREDLDRNIGITRLPCNWLQIMENSMDPVHVEYLHGLYMNYVLKRQGRPPAVNVRHHEKIGFTVFDWGIYKRRLLEGQSEDSTDWTTGHPVLFPATLAVDGLTDGTYFQVRVPMDDEHTMHFWYYTKPRPAGAPPQTSIPRWEMHYQHEDGSLVTDNVNAQDMLAWITQGPRSDRTTERLGNSDKGVILYRNLLLEQAEKVERGEDPLGVIRDPERNRMIEFPREGPSGAVKFDAAKMGGEVQAAVHSGT